MARSYCVQLRLNEWERIRNWFNHAIMLCMLERRLVFWGENCTENAVDVETLQKKVGYLMLAGCWMVEKDIWQESFESKPQTCAACFKWSHKFWGFLWGLQWDSGVAWLWIISGMVCLGNLTFSKGKSSRTSKFGALKDALCHAQIHPRGEYFNKLMKLLTTHRVPVATDLWSMMTAFALIEGSITELGEGVNVLKAAWPYLRWKAFSGRLADQYVRKCLLRRPQGAVWLCCVPRLYILRRSSCEDCQKDVPRVRQGESKTREEVRFMKPWQAMVQKVSALSFSLEA